MSGRVEIITGPERRRRWSDEEKLQLVAEACRPGNSVSQVARQRGNPAFRVASPSAGARPDHRQPICGERCPSTDVLRGRGLGGTGDPGCRRGGAADTATESGSHLG